ncbi:PadR family transcriptional regulator [Granulicella sibirica]|uniref:Transcriptional regulator, PadR family n=1 Tax=Granulicella sibirica TaxID=2479048 RepID=A0A4Q0SX70_9BACT|nr:PadR family transcriptional regulator [Granulicella sibirica]RXH55022.1 Transcriptional regulator, PadR family [Granulicella sibirica]
MYLADMKKALSNSTVNALLGLLSIKPMSGYDLRQFIPESIGHFWSESYGQIYPTLRRMAEEGLVAKRTETQRGKPDRHVYSLTGAGRERLQQWLELPFAVEVPRNELLLKMFFGAHATSAVNRKHIHTFLEKEERDLQMFTSIAEFLRMRAGDDPQLPYWLITLSRGRHEASGNIAWAHETLEELDRLEQTAPSKSDHNAPKPGIEAHHGA